jgi:hypothetical protein
LITMRVAFFCIQVKVHSTLNVSYSAQQLTHNGVRIDIADAEAPLSSLSILAGDTIYVGEDLTADTTNDESLFDSAFATIVDIPDSSSGGSSKAPLALERGFRGSALMEFQPHTSSSSGSGSSSAIAVPAGVKRGLSADDAMCCDDSSDSANVAEYIAAAAAAAAAEAEQPDTKKQCLDATAQQQSDETDEVVSIVCESCGMLNIIRADGQLCIDCSKPLLE